MYFSWVLLKIVGCEKWQNVLMEAENERNRINMGNSDHRVLSAFALALFYSILETT